MGLLLALGGIVMAYYALAGSLLFAGSLIGLAGLIRLVYREYINRSVNVHIDAITVSSSALEQLMDIPKFHQLVHGPSGIH
jgi:hypothetical protein